jgi:hypothetical protein
MQLQPGSCLPVEQRRMPDRRTRPTSFCSAAFRFRGRRAGFRRSAEGARAYIDRPSWRIILLVLFVMLSSVCDAFFTLIHLDNGGSEANPMMALVLRQGTASFLRVKMSLTGRPTSVFRSPARACMPWLLYMGYYCSYMPSCCGHKSTGQTTPVPGQ